MTKVQTLLAIKVAISWIWAETFPLVLKNSKIFLLIFISSLSYKRLKMSLRNQSQFCENLPRSWLRKSKTFPSHNFCHFLSDTFLLLLYEGLFFAIPASVDQLIFKVAWKFFLLSLLSYSVSSNSSTNVPTGELPLLEDSSTYCKIRAATRIFKPYSP